LICEFAQKRVLSRHLFWLSDEAWAAIEPHLPRDKPGKPRVDDRTVISGILHVLDGVSPPDMADTPKTISPPSLSSPSSTSGSNESST